MRGDQEYQLISLLQSDQLRYLQTQALLGEQKIEDARVWRGCYTTKTHVMTLKRTGKIYGYFFTRAEA